MQIHPIAFEGDIDDRDGAEASHGHSGLFIDGFMD